MRKSVSLLIMALAMLMPMCIGAQKKRYSAPIKFEDGMQYCWERKKGKYALVVKQPGYQDYVLTDYIYDVSNNAVRYGVKFEFYGLDNYKLLNSKYILVEKGGKLGVINGQGLVIEPCEYTEVLRFSGSFAYTIKKSKEKYSEIGRETYSYFDLVVKGKNGKWGTISSSKGGGIKPIYDKVYCPKHIWVENKEGMWLGYNPISYIKEDYAIEFIIEKKGKYGLATTEKEIVPPLYDKESFLFSNVKPFVYKEKYNYNPKHNIFQTIVLDRNLYLLVKDGKKMWYDVKNGNTIYIGEPEKEKINKTNRNFYYQYSIGGCFGYVIENGYTIPALYGEKIECLSVTPTDSADIYIVKNAKNENLIGLYNAKLKKEILAPEYTKIIKTDLHDGFFLVEKDSTASHYAYISQTRDSVVLLQNKQDAFLNAEAIQIDSTLSILKNGKAYGLCDSESGLMLPCIYDSIKPVENVVSNIKSDYNGLFVTYLNNRKGVVSRDAVITLPYYNNLEFKNDTLNLECYTWPVIYGHYNKNKFKMYITKENDDYAIDFNWNQILDIVAKNKSNNDDDYSDVISFSKYIDNQMLTYAAMLKQWQVVEEVLLNDAKNSVYSYSKTKTKFIAMYYAAIEYRTDEEKDQHMDYMNAILATSDAISAEKKAQDDREREARYKEYEEQQRQRRIAAEQARIERQQQWENLAAALGNMANNISAAVNSSKSRKRAKTYTYNNNNTNTRRSSANTHSHNHSSTSSSSGSSVERCDECGGDGKCTKVTSNLTLFKTYCKGTGKCHNCIDGLVKDAFGTRLCSYCNGSGKCYHCKGTGKCTKCHGTGKIVKKK